MNRLTQEICCLIIIKNNMTCMYSYEITKYIRNCLRIWCLIDDQDKRKYELGLKNQTPI